MSWLKSVTAAVLGQALALGAFIGAIELDAYLRPGKEHWDILLSSLAGAFAIQFLLIKLALGSLALNKSFWICMAVLKSWISGFVFFLFIDSAVETSSFKFLPLTAVLVSTIVLTILIRNKTKAAA